MGYNESIIIGGKGIKEWDVFKCNICVDHPTYSILARFYFKFIQEKIGWIFFFPSNNALEIIQWTQSDETPSQAFQS